MHIALKLAPRCIDKLSEIEAYLLTLGITEDGSDMLQDETVGYEIFHAAKNGPLHLKWSLGFTPPEGAEPDEFEPCVMTIVTLQELIDGEYQVILDLTYFPNRDEWQIEHLSTSLESFEKMARDEQVRHLIFNQTADHVQAFIIIAAMAKLFKTPRPSSPPTEN